MAIVVKGRQQGRKDGKDWPKLSYWIDMEVDLFMLLSY